MIKKIARAAGLTFTDETADMVSAACSDMPFWVRKACSFIHLNTDIESRPLSLPKETAKELLSRFIEQEGATLAQVALAHLFRVYPELELPALACLEDQSDAAVNAQVTVLRKYGVLASNNPIRPSGEMIKQAMILYKEQRDAAPLQVQPTLPIGTYVTDKTALGEWADDLAVINKSRNLLEKKLRQLVLNFLRADTLASKKRGTTRDRVLAALPSERRAQLNHLSADEAIEKFMWAELIATIQREWQIFASAFGDRKQFDGHVRLPPGLTQTVKTQYAVR
jgi:hypothetical protein